MVSIHERLSPVSAPEAEEHSLAVISDLCDDIEAQTDETQNQGLFDVINALPIPSQIQRQAVRGETTQERAAALLEDLDSIAKLGGPSTSYGARLEASLPSTPRGYVLFRSSMTSVKSGSLYFPSTAATDTSPTPSPPPRPRKRHRRPKSSPATTNPTRREVIDLTVEEEDEDDETIRADDDVSQSGSKRKAITIVVDDSDEDPDWEKSKDINAYTDRKKLKGKPLEALLPQDNDGGIGKIIDQEFAHLAGIISQEDLYEDEDDGE